MNRRVMIADDVAEIRRLLGVIIRRYTDFEVVGEAEDGKQAVLLARELVPDIVLLDLNMPVSSGFEALPEIRGALPDAAIVVFSGFEGDHLVEMTARMGADAYIEKGTPPRDILDRIRAAALRRAG